MRHNHKPRRRAESRQESRPVVAWSIMADMIASFDDEQLQTLDGLVYRERSRRRNGEDPGQYDLFGAQAIVAAGARYGR